MTYDFSGYATKNDLLCADGRIIRRNAFAENDGQTVPLVWHHIHSDPTNVLGHALLENREDGVYAYGTFNNTEKGKAAKELVKNGDVTSLSIFANRLKQNGNDVVHGMIREVSLVLSGANPGASIEHVSFAHADTDSDDGFSYTQSSDEAIIYSGLEQAVSFSHADDDNDADDQNNQKEEEKVADKERTVADVFDEFTDEQKNAVYFLIGQAIEENGGSKAEEVDDTKPVKHADDEADESDDSQETKSSGKTVQDVFNSLTEEQKNVVYFLIGQAVEEAGKSGGTVKHSNFDGDDYMKRNVFDEAYTEDNNTPNETLSHDEFMAIMEDARKSNSLKDVFLAHGITNIGLLFPEAKLVKNQPDLITRQMDWVDAFWNGVRRIPFSRFRSYAANLTADEARAKGYIKGNKKGDQVLSMLGRETTPQTIYKKQTLDRDDVIDITELDVIAFLKQELRMMLNEELCRAALVGDGRGINAPDKIKPDKIRPIYGDDDTYVIYYEVGITGTDTTDQKAAKIADAAVRARKDYKGSGTPWFFATNEVIADLMLAKDTIGRRLFKDENELKAALRVSKIVEVPVMEGIQRSRAADATAGITAATMDLLALIVNPKDYTVGADKGGAVSLFDDFDIDYNQMKYLIETLCSCALTTPYSAIALEVESF